MFGIIAKLFLPRAERKRFHQRRAYAEYEQDGMEAMVRASWLSGLEELQKPSEERDLDPFGASFRKHLDEQFRSLQAQRH